MPLMWEFLRYEGSQHQCVHDADPVILGLEEVPQFLSNSHPATSCEPFEAWLLHAGVWERMQDLMCLYCT